MFCFCPSDIISSSSSLKLLLPSPCFACPSIPPFASGGRGDVDGDEERGGWCQAGVLQGLAHVAVSSRREGGSERALPAAGSSAGNAMCGTPLFQSRPKFTQQCMGLHRQGDSVAGFQLDLESSRRRGWISGRQKKFDLVPTRCDPSDPTRRSRP
mmetsp:Transcript_34312/g.51758  ORF Transcript_34312/g.51758 Transcript_34312/m.51758 type:complete len:155 (-) Transcript_34312:51-515(-)